MRANRETIYLDITIRSMYLSLKFSAKYFVIHLLKAEKVHFHLDREEFICLGI